MPRFTDSSAATRACPQVGFSSAIRTMSLRMFSGRRGRPTRDFHFQKQLETLAMPADKRLRLDDHQSALPSRTVETTARVRDERSWLIFVVAFLVLHRRLAVFAETGFQRRGLNANGRSYRGNEVHLPSNRKRSQRTKRMSVLRCGRNLTWGVRMAQSQLDREGFSVAFAAFSAGEASELSVSAGVR
jgi:hypothetical protein